MLPHLKAPPLKFGLKTDTIFSRLFMKTKSKKFYICKSLRNSMSLHLSKMSRLNSKFWLPIMELEFSNRGDSNARNNKEFIIDDYRSLPSQLGDQAQARPIPGGYGNGQYFPKQRCLLPDTQWWYRAVWSERSQRRHGHWETLVESLTGDSTFRNAAYSTLGSFICWRQPKK